MEVISNICSILIILAVLTAPVLFAIFVVKWCRHKEKRWIGLALAICMGSILPLTLIGTFTDPATYCEHEYTLVEETAPTCTEKGQIVQTCSLCGREDVSDVEATGHVWETDSIVEATCTGNGYILERCDQCNTTQKNDTGGMLEHNMQEVSRVEPTYDSAGEIINECVWCGEQETFVLEQLVKPSQEVVEEETVQAEVIREEVAQERETVSEEILTRQDIVDAAKRANVSYKNILRYPDTYVGEYIVIEVKVSQVLEGRLFDTEIYYFGYTDEDGLELYWDDEYCLIDRRVDDETKILTDDIIRVYGRVAGTQFFKRALTRTEVELPVIEILYLDLIEE